MKNKIQMRVAKHMFAIWLKPGDKESLKESLSQSGDMWNRLSRRVLRTWIKSLSKNPERYEFTGMAYKELRLCDFFTGEECNDILMKVFNVASGSDVDYILRIICQRKLVYKLDTETTLKEGIEEYCNSGKYHRRPVKPVLKGIK